MLAILCQLTLKQIWNYNRQIFPEKLALCLFDLLTMTFQGQTFLTVHGHRGPFCNRESVFGGHELPKKV